MLKEINSLLSVAYKDRDRKYSSNDMVMRYVNEDNVYVTFQKVNKLRYIS
jgi:uncharacterized protein YlbG (UPF0298 family)